MPTELDSNDATTATKEAEAWVKLGFLSGRGGGGAFFVRGFCLNREIDLPQCF